MPRLGQALMPGVVPQHRIVDVFDDLVERFRLVMMRIDVDDQEILVAALHRLLGRVRQRLRGVVVLQRYVAKLDVAGSVRLRIHRLSSRSRL